MKIKNLIPILLLTTFCGIGCKQEQIKQPNVLFISIDDLNDWEGKMGGNPQAITPNLDKLDARITKWMETDSIPVWLR